MANQRVIPINIEDEMKNAYIDYSMSVIVSRALPDVRDGLKPVHRRILFGMDELSLAYNKSHKKSARIVGEVLGKYHPHGDTAVYDAMVRMAQEWSMRYPLVDGQGNFGSMDGDSPAAMRYTEARMARITNELIQDLKKDTVDFRLNFDDTLEEPTVLPTKLPTLLINGSSGIAVGMATNMLPHNLTEVINGIFAAIDNPDITVQELMDYIKGPDFPTGGIIYGTQGIEDAFETGRGKIVVRGRAEIESTATGREQIIISEIPYQVNKASLVAKIAELVNTEKITGVADVRDESDRRGLRVVVDVKRDAMAKVILSQLFKYTQLQTSYGVNNIALVKGRPMMLNLKDLIREYIAFRLEVIVRRTQFELKKAEDRAHILEGLLIAIDHLDEVIALIRSSRTVDEANSNLQQTFQLSALQAKAILEMRLQKLTGLEREKVKEEYDALMIEIARLKGILDDEGQQYQIIKDELTEIKDRFGDERRTGITFAEGEVKIEDLIPNEEMVITISHLGYIKRTNSLEYRTQGRGGRGSKGSKTRNADFVEHILIGNSHDYLLLFTEQGKCHWLRVFEIPEGAKTGSGRVVQNLIELPKDDKIRAYIIIKDLKDVDFLENHYIVFCTKQGIIKKTSVESFSRPRSNGIIAININEGDQLLEVKLTGGQSEVLIANKMGRAIRFNESKVRSMGRTATGVRGIRLSGKGDEVVGMVCIDTANDTDNILVLSEKGNGKRSDLNDYRITNRGGKGVKTMQLTEKTGKLIAIKAVSDEDDLIITNKSGIVIRTGVDQIRTMGRATQGVRIIKLDPNDEISDVAIVRNSSKDSEDEEE